MWANIVKLFLWFAPVGKAFGRLLKSLPAIVASVEEYAKDGKIDMEERKIIATKAVEIFAKDNNIKLNRLLRISIAILINSIAKSLPARDLEVSKVILDSIKDVKG